ncbi:glycoside hydrolase family 38 N-terminal domain-containing protein [Flavobacterium branchiicola]|uniref:Glycoside hydrolase family 38 C-terminal domain-containing protein n=1 Tax=Flavobacterium branchiicola TaxID=1114875 RepID=A0ABV9PHW4_9FLAO|nr:glycoside hydrolase family 38 C-terminal domain-containing protein [Flavobacterium branchiicola]MBS7255766.1 glycoside hydrolase [Flavobacterium branchiicola]
MKVKIVFALLLAFSVQSLFAQKEVPFFGKINWINGFAKEISGENITYSSAFQDYATVALLTRTTDGNKTIEWETAPVPANSKDKYVYFSWVAGHSSGTSSGERNFDLYVNDEKTLTFTTFPKNQKTNWIFKAKDESALVFEQIKLDGANDAQGYAFLRLPVSKIKPGLTARIKIVGQNQRSNDWFMTFKFGFEENVKVTPMPFLLKNGTQPLALTVLHFGKDQAVKVKINEKESYTYTAKDGINSFDIPVKAVTNEEKIKVEAWVGNKKFISDYFVVKPVVYREMHLLHHSHTDIGYSHLQPEIVKIHNKNIDDALEMIEKTKSYPEEAKFKWNIESVWAVENYLKEASATQKAKFIAAVKNGDILLSALYVNMLTGLSQAEEMFHYTDYAAQLRKEFGFTINSAMISDVPGFAWSTVTALSKGGVKYFSIGSNFMGIDHPYRGDRAGHFLKNWGDKPVWWTSPSGEEKVLFWAGAKGYSSWHGMQPGNIYERGARKIADYLNELTANNYPYDMVQWRFNIVADNGPIEPNISDFVKNWNEKYASPKLILNTADKMFEAFERKYGAVIPTVKGDLTPYWEDGALSTAEEEGKNRVNSLRLQQLATLYTMLNPKKYNQQNFYEAWRNIIMFHEHTWGAHNSISDPDASFVTEQWRIKKQFMLDADAQINTLEKNLLETYSSNESKKIAVFNTSSWARTGLVTLQTSINGKSVKDVKGNIYPLQKLSNGTTAFIATEVPALGSAVYEITDKEALIKNPFVITTNSLSNGKIEFIWDRNNGSITSLKSTSDFNYAGNFKNQGLNSYWYVPGLNPEEVQTNGNVEVKVLETGSVMTQIALTSEAPGANKLQRIVSLYGGSEELLIENILDKKAIRTKEGVHFGYPFNSQLKTTTLDAGYGSITFLKDQLPGSNMDYLYGKRWVDVSDGDKGIQWMFLEAPLVEPNSIIDERKEVVPNYKEWKKTEQPTSIWFSYVMNNYWHTNYKADQEGIVRFKYALRPHLEINNVAIEKEAQKFTQPLIAMPVMNNVKLPSGLFELTNSKIIVTSLSPNEDGSILMRLFNPEKTEQTTKWIWKSLQPKSITARSTGIENTNTAEIKMAGSGVSEYILKF